MSRPKSAALRLMALEDRTVPAVLNLTTVGSSGVINGALFSQAAPVAASSLHPFLELNTPRHGLEQGYNTDARPLQFSDEVNSPSATHALKLGDVPVVTVNGQTYYEFVLDVNQRQAHPRLSLDELRIYSGTSATLTGYNPHTHELGGLSPIYDLDAGGNNWVKLNANLNRGKPGVGDMVLDVPASAFGSAGPDSFVYLYSKFGGHFRANGGPEIWSVGTPASTNNGSISGTVFTDANANGVLDAGETGMANLVVFIDANGNGILDANEKYTTTDANGHYSFTGLASGPGSPAYAIRVLTTGTASLVPGVDPTTSPADGVTTQLPTVTLTTPNEAFTAPDIGATTPSSTPPGGPPGGPPLT
jgi:hypothetical protein